MLVKLLKGHPHHPIGETISKKLSINLSKENLDAEVAYFTSEAHKTFARTYGLAFMLDYARAVGNQKSESAIVDRARFFYLKDRDYPTRYEPSGQDFFSSCLNEADLIRRVLSREECSRWFDGFLPRLREGDRGNLLVPFEVSDVTDGYIVHLAGLDLSRAW